MAWGSIAGCVPPPRIGLTTDGACISLIFVFSPIWVGFPWNQSRRNGAARKAGEREGGTEGGGKGWGEEGGQYLKQTVETYSCRVVKGEGKRAKLGPGALLRPLLLSVGWIRRSRTRRFGFRLSHLALPVTRVLRAFCDWSRWGVLWLAA